MRTCSIIAVALFTFTASHLSAQAQRPDKPMQMKIDETVAAYAAAWNEPDVAARRQLLEKAWAVNGVYTDPSAHVEGRDALVKRISGYQKSLPNTQLAATSQVDTHHNQIRFTWKIVRADGSTVTEGMDFGVIDADGRLSRIVGFFGPFSPK